MLICDILRDWESSKKYRREEEDEWLFAKLKTVQEVAFDKLEM